MPKLSVILPVYNTEKYLPKCLDSILNQTFEDFEVICVNNNSTDNSLEILSEHAQEDKRIKIISKQNQGQAVSKNVGLQNSNGEFVYFVDSDDWLELEAFETAMNNFSSDIDVVCFGANVILDKEFELNEKILKLVKNEKEYHKIKFKGKLELSNNIILETTLNLWNKIFRKSIITNYNISFLEDLSYADDVSFTYKYLLICKNAYFIDKYMYNYLKRPGSVMAKIKNRDQTHIADNFLASYDVYNFLKSNNILNERMSVFLNILYCRFYDDYITCNENSSELLFKTIREITLKMDLGPGENNIFIKDLKNGNYDNCVNFVKGIYSHEF